MGPLLGGYLWEVTGSLDASFYFMGAVMLGGSVFPVLLPAALARKGRREGTSVRKKEEEGEKKA